MREASGKIEHRLERFEYPSGKPHAPPEHSSSCGELLKGFPKTLSSSISNLSGGLERLRKRWTNLFWYFVNPKQALEPGTWDPKRFVFHFDECLIRRQG